jgi:hypothetical protein
MMLQLTLPPNYSPTLTLYTRLNATLVGPSVPGTAVSGRPTLYDFNLNSLATGDYVVDINNPAGRLLLRKTSTDYLLASEWWQLECSGNSGSDPGKVLVNQDYGGPGALVYCLDGVPVADATIEVFLYMDYVAGKQDATYRVANSRQTVDGDWAMPVYLDPEIYVLRYYRTGVAGPDAYRVVVTFNPADIDITPINPVPSQITLGLRQALTGANPPKPPKTYYTEPPPGAVTVDHNYGGKDNLVYRLNNKVVADAIIQVFTLEDYEKKPADLLAIVASTRQNADGSWASAVHLLPGKYVLHCFKKNVAGPDSFNITVE